MSKDAHHRSSIEMWRHLKRRSQGRIQPPIPRVRMRILRYVTFVYLLVASGHLQLSESFMPSLQTRTRNIVVKSHMCQRPCLMMHLQADTIAGAVSQMAYVIADGSREVAAVEQIPYVPGEVIGFDKIVIGSAACVLAYAWAAYEFGKRIVTQRACQVCEGSGLVTTSRKGKKLRRPIKCYSCGGFLPWENWGRFWQSNMDVGNGGVLQRPAPDYDELNEAARSSKESRQADKEK